jgi:hypothetical protein
MNEKVRVYDFLLTLVGRAVYNVTTNVYDSMGRLSYTVNSMGGASRTVSHGYDAESLSYTSSQHRI